ncbi:carboxypeptidase-like regulatory domain-containing protein [Lacinutrix neustonica]|uniref:Carboxypeptidase-like regulatory domain-containing protein n=1 Tax=Lacinutrix neustonica TaxID=2980107 RepID=A0A9E8SGY6_9FLAO|nr:carboxypeptidase-like regulatory domain-containing protein [Lacinutrix neustonica]WAC02180.1 carboxypeptidase-like regulatory domain-containing protein [Lacinutrix neustonica]
MKIANTSFRFMLSLMMVLSTLFTSCEPHENSDPFNPGENNETGLDLGSSIQRDFMGRIVDETNLPIENVMVTIGTKVASTDANGMFIINNTDVKQKQAFIIAQKPGFLNGMRSVVPTQGVNRIKIMLITENLAGTVASEALVRLPYLMGQK